MIAELSLLVCLAQQPHVCERVLPDMTHQDGAPLSFQECLGIGGQAVALAWLGEHPGYVLRKVECSVANDRRRLREQLQQPSA